jgi:hypothetical protein
MKPSVTSHPCVPVYFWTLHFVVQKMLHGWMDGSMDALSAPGRTDSATEDR